MIRRRSRPVRAMVTALLAAGLTGGVPAAAKPAGPATVGSTLRVTGSGAAFGYVRLARPLRGDELRFSARGDDGQLALMLTSDGPFTSEPRYLLAQRLPRSVGKEWTVTMGGPGVARWVLPAGRYRLYLVARTRTTVTVTRTRQTAPPVSVAPRVRVRHRVSELPAAQVAGKVRPVSEVNETYTFGRPGLAVASAVLDYASMWDYSLGGCFYDGRPPPGEDVAQVCAGGTAVGTGGGYLVPSTTPNRITGGLLTLPVRPRTVSFGVYYRFAGELTKARQFLLWLEFEP